MSHDFLAGGRVPDEVWYHLQQAFDRRGWMGHLDDLAGRLRTANYWLVVGVVATGSLVHVLESIASCEPPAQSAG